MTDSGAIDLSGVEFEDLVAEMIRRCGDSPDREGMAKTPGLDPLQECLVAELRGENSKSTSGFDATGFNEVIRSARTRR